MDHNMSNLFNLPGSVKKFKECVLYFSTLNAAVYTLYNIFANTLISILVNTGAYNDLCKGTGDSAGADDQTSNWSMAPLLQTTQVIVTLFALNDKSLVRQEITIKYFSNSEQ